MNLFVTKVLNFGQFWLIFVHSLPGWKTNDDGSQTFQSPDGTVDKAPPQESDPTGGNVKITFEN